MAFMTVRGSLARFYGWAVNTFPEWVRSILWYSPLAIILVAAFLLPHDPGVIIGILGLAVAVGLALITSRTKISNFLAATLIRETSTPIEEPPQVQDWQRYKARSMLPPNWAGRPPYSFDAVAYGPQSQPHQYLIWWIPRSPEETVEARFAGGNWWPRFSRQLCLSGMGQLSNSFDEIRKEVRAELMLRTFSMKPNARPRDNYRLARIKGVAESNGHLVLTLERVQYVDHAWTGERGADRRLIGTNRTVEQMLTEVDSGRHLGSKASFFDAGSWPRGVALHSSVIVLCTDESVLVCIKGIHSVGGYGELTTTACGGSQYWSLRLRALNAPFYGGLDPSRATMIRELREETAVRASPDALMFMGVATYPTRVGWHPEFHYVTGFRGNASPILARWARAMDADETTRTRFTMPLPELRYLGERAGIPFAGDLASMSISPPETYLLNPPLVAAIHLLGRMFHDRGREQALNEIFSHADAE